jgi:hypothetical protein
MLTLIYKSNFKPPFKDEIVQHDKDNDAITYDFELLSKNEVIQYKTYIILRKKLNFMNMIVRMIL